jgi:two-component system, sensor histidine kinase
MDAMTVEQAITAEQARHIHAQIPTAVIGGFVIACIAAAVFAGGAPRGAVALWLGANFMVAAFRFGTWQVFKRNPFDATGWLRTAMVGAALSGAVWGAGALFMFDSPDIAYHLLYVFAVMMMGVASMFSFGVHLPTFLCFFLLSAVPATAGLLAERTLLHAEIAAGIAIFVGVALRFVREFQRVFVHAQRLRFENAELLLARSRFLAAASHDLRQPMHALGMYLGNLAGQELGAEARATLGNALQCARTMDGMFSALLDISRIDAGAVQPEPRAFVIGAMIERLRLEFEPQVRAKGLELRVADCSAAVRADPAFALARSRSGLPLW